MRRAAPRRQRIGMAGAMRRPMAKASRSLRIENLLAALRRSGKAQRSRSRCMLARCTILVWIVSAFITRPPLSAIPSAIMAQSRGDVVLRRVDRFPEAARWFSRRRRDLGAIFRGMPRPVLSPHLQVDITENFCPAPSLMSRRASISPPRQIRPESSSALTATTAARLRYQRSSNELFSSRRISPARKASMPNTAAKRSDELLERG